MKIYLFALVVLINCFASFSQGIVFEKHTNISQVLMEAKQQNKLVFIDAYTPWCAPCKQMSNEVFPQSEVGGFYNSHFINLELNMDAPENKHLAEKFVVTSFPAFVFLNANGDLVHRAIGAMSSDEFIALGKTAIDSLSNFLFFSKQVKAGVRTADILEKYFDFIPYSDEKDALAVEYLNAIDDKEKLSPKGWYFFNQYVYSIQSAPFLFFAKNINSFIESYGEEKVKAKMVTLFQTKYVENRKYFKSLIKYNRPFFIEVEKQLVKKI